MAFNRKNLTKRHPKHTSTKLSAEKVRAIIKEHYEPERRDRCKLAIYRNKIKPLTGISERTFWRYMNEMEIIAHPSEDVRQLKFTF